VAPFAVFSDFDGTITDVDTFNVLVRSVAGDAEWDAIDGELIAGRITLRETLRREAELVRLTHVEALAMLEEHARVDPRFPPFVARVRAEGGTIAVVSAGIRSIILETLRRAGVDDVPVIANDVDYHHEGWRMTFVDDSVFGHDKSACVRAARDAGWETVYCGDGISDYSAIALADRRFVRAGSSLVRYCTERQLAFTPFRSFDEVEAALYG
jgi:2-hydroxy-3-keto-5-methylthiopentenyl-1-phosphate phosphatase